MPPRRPPPFPKSAMLSAMASSPTAPATRQRHPSSVHDAHVHLWAGEEILSLLYWQKDPSAALAVVCADHAADDYQRAVATALEARKERSEGGTHVQIEVSHSTGEWTAAIRETEWLVGGQLQTGNLGTVVPWAPVPEGSEAVARYIAQLPEPAKASLRGFRYLLQDFPPVSETSDNPILSEQFIDSLSYLVKHGYSFDFTIDARRFGVEVLQNVLDCVNKVQAAQETNGPAARFIIDHLGKPDLASVVGKAVPPTALTDYERIMAELSFQPSIHIKYSGYLSQLPAELAAEAFQEFASGHTGPAYQESKKAIASFMSPVLEAFGEDRIMWGSDWPICKIGVLSKDASANEQDKIWGFDYRLGLDVLLDIGLPDEALDKIFCKNAQKFYASL